jgi:diguanylate cyclase (GGDEF)-like protein
MAVSKATDRASDEDRRGPRDIGGHLLGAAVAAMAVGLIAPLLLGTFTVGERVALVIVEAVCLVVAGLSGIVLTRRLQASRMAYWALARKDELTSVGNYRALHERLTEEVARHTRRSREFALVLIDLDGFKQVNERLGHLEGDRVLAEIGAALLDEVRSEDSVFRQGGDEFAVIAPETNGEEAEDVAARLRTRLRECGQNVGVSAGTGFAVYPVDGRSIDELLGFADRELMAAKQGGRTD